MKKILIADDDMDIVELVKNRLVRNDYEVIFSNDGDDAFKKALKHLPDLIIMDVMMPKLSGGEAVKLLKSNDKTKNIPVLFLSVLAENLPSNTEFRGINVSGKLYPAITKPFEADELLSSIRLILGE